MTDALDPRSRGYRLGQRRSPTAWRGAVHGATEVINKVPISPSAITAASRNLITIAVFRHESLPGTTGILFRLTYNARTID